MPINNNYTVNQNGKQFNLTSEQIPAKTTGGRVAAGNYEATGSSIILPSPVINAVDIDWNGVSVRNTTVNTTGELLNVIENISGGTATGITIQGKQGAQGTRGLQGPAGASATGAGMQGRQGIKGDKGDQGIRGLQGPAGASATGTGMQGRQGIKGDKGDQGNRGLQGPAGASATGAGMQGRQGAVGANGATGPKGANGVTGPRGLQGPAGSSATGMGVQGKQGSQGIAGSNGSIGIQGPIGFQGKQGAAGSSVNFTASGAATHVTYWKSDSELDYVANVYVQNGFIYESSDERIKNNIHDIAKEDYDKILSKILTKEYDLADGEHKIGFIAQELENVIPTAVKYNIDTDLYSVHYTEALAAYCGALHTKILELEARLAALEK